MSLYGTSREFQGLQKLYCSLLGNPTFFPLYCPIKFCLTICGVDQLFYTRKKMLTLNFLRNSRRFQLRQYSKKIAKTVDVTEISEPFVELEVTGRTAKDFIIANNARDVAKAIVSRLNDKALNTTVRSFECAENRPTRCTKLATRNGVDLHWMNVWFTELFSDKVVEFYPFIIPPAAEWESEGRRLFEAIEKVNKHKNSDFFKNLADGNKNKIPTEEETLAAASAAEKREKDLQHFINEHVVRVPVAVTSALTELIIKFSAEEITELTLKKHLRKAVGMHSQILHVLHQKLDFTYHSVRFLK